MTDIRDLDPDEPMFDLPEMEELDDGPSWSAIATVLAVAVLLVIAMMVVVARVT